MDLLLDTHALAWLASNDKRLSPRLVAAMADPDTSLLVSAVTAYEYSDLLVRGRLPSIVDIEILQAVLGFALIDYPASLWPIAVGLPQIHGDPIDRMLIAQALSLDCAIATADADMQRYPVKIVW